MKIPFLDVAYANRALKQDLLARWEQIIDTGQFVGGDALSSCERAMAKTFGTRHFSLVNSGTDALRFALLALDLGPGDEVITVANTFIATTEAISQCGATPVFVDMDPVTYTMDPDAVAAAITPQTRGILPVHLYGHPADLDPLLHLASKHGLWLVEDAAQAHGTRYRGKNTGSFGAAAAYSFYPGKNLGACGEAGGVGTNQTALDKKIRMYRDHGQSKKYEHQLEGYNGRCDALQAAALEVKLSHLATWQRARTEIAAWYESALKPIPGLVLPSTAEWATHGWHLYVIQCEDRDALAKALNRAGVGTGMHYPVPLHLQPAYKHLGYSPGDLPHTEAMATRLLSLPLYPGLTPSDIDYIANQVGKSLSAMC